MLKFGLIGYGAWGRLHAAAIARTQGAELVAIAAHGNSSRADARAAYPGVEILPDSRELLLRKDIDAVSIVTPNALHENLAVAALEAGKHVLLEKPMALSAAGCDRILGAQRRAKRVLNIGHELRLSAQWGAIKRLVDEGRIGNPRCANFSLWRRPFRSGSGEWRYDPGQVGTWLLEELVHYVDLMAWYFESLGEPITVSAVGTRRPDVAQLYDNVTVTIGWENGAYALVTQALCGFEDHKLLALSGTRGAVRATWSGEMDRTHEPRFSVRLLTGLDGTERFDNGKVEELSLEAGSSELIELDALIEAMVQSVYTGRAVVAGEVGRRAVTICEAAALALETGSVVRLGRTA